MNRMKKQAVAGGRPVAQALGGLALLRALTSTAPRGRRLPECLRVLARR